MQILDCGWSHTVMHICSPHLSFMIHWKHVHLCCKHGFYMGPRCTIWCLIQMPIALIHSFFSFHWGFYLRNLAHRFLRWFWIIYIKELSPRFRLWKQSDWAQVLVLLFSCEALGKFLKLLVPFIPCNMGIIIPTLFIMKIKWDNECNCP